MLSGSCAAGGVLERRMVEPSPGVLVSWCDSCNVGLHSTV